MANVKLTQKPVVAIDATTQFTATKIVNGAREVVQIAQADLKGLDGKSSIASITGVSPANIPAVGQQVQYAVDNSAGFVVDQIVAVGAASTLKVVGLPTATSIVLENIDATVGAVATGTKIVPSGKKGANGLDSVVPGPAGVNAFTTVTTQFIIPAANANVIAIVGSTAFMSDNMTLQISGKFFRVASITSTTQVSLTNTLASQSGTIAATSKVVAAGEPGPSGLDGSSGGLKYTYLSTAGTPGTGQLRCPDLSIAGTVTISSTDNQSEGAGDLLSRLKIGAIIEIAKDINNRSRGTITTEYNSTTTAFSWDSVAAYGSISGNSTVFISILSDAPSTVSSGGSGGGISWVVANSTPQAAALDTGYIGKAGSSQFSLPGAATVGKVFALASASTDQKTVSNGLIIFPSGLSDQGVRNKTTAPRAAIELVCVDDSAITKQWQVRSWSSPSDWELYDPAGPDADVLAIYTAIENVLTANSLATSLLTGIIKSAIEDRVLAKKSNGTWISTLIYYGFVGGAITTNPTAAQAIDSINFRAPGTYNISTWANTTFTRNALGVAANAANGLTNTQLEVNSTTFPSTGWVMGVYNTSVITETDAFLMSASTNSHVLYRTLSGLQFAAYGGGAQDFNFATPGQKGFKAGIRINGSQVKIAAGGSVSAALASAQSSAATLGNLFLFCRTDNNFGTTASFGSAWANNAPWSDTQIAQERTDEIAYQTALARN